MNRTREIVRVLALTMAVIVLSACGGKATATPTKTPETKVTPDVAAANGSTTAPASKTKMTLATATQGGVFWPLGQEMASIWNENVTQVEIAAINTGGTTDNIQKLGIKEVDMGLAVSGVVFYAVSGTGEYKAQGKQENLRGVLALHPNVIHILVRDEASISSVNDIRGKNWAPGASGSATEINTREIAGVFGMDSGSDLKGFYLGYNETVDLMKAGRVDGATLAAGVGGKAVKDALALGGWKILSLSQTEVDAITKAFPSYFPITVPAGSYTGQTEPILTVAQASILITRADVSDEVVYGITKAFYQNLSRLATKVDAAKVITVQDALKGITGVVPLHPGAAKYFREVGLNF